VRNPIIGITYSTPSHIAAFKTQKVVDIGVGEKESRKEQR
jgi:hypothetical protein